MKREYELVVIVRPTVEDEELTALLDRVRGWIDASGGEVVKTEPWGRRKLSFPIEKQREGTYVYFQTNIEPLAVENVERNLRLNEDVLRHLVVRVGS